MYKYYSLLISILLVSAKLRAQNQSINGKIEGTVTADQKPIEGATVSVIFNTDTLALRNAVSDKSGHFVFTQLQSGTYKVVIDMLGYEKQVSETFALTSSNNTKKMDSIALKNNSQQLSSVSVTAKKPFIENKIDKTVINVDAAPSNTGLTALELLEKSPGVQVDNDGNISLKGKKGVLILIDGKPTYLSGQALTDYLKNLPSSELEQLEIMTQPPAKYDAAGNSGVINIKTKKSKANGFNANLTTSAIFAQYFKNTNNINLNWRKDKFNFFGSYGYTDWRGFNTLTLSRDLRTSKDLPFNRYSEQVSNNTNNYNGHDYKVGVDFFASKKTTVGVTVKGSIEKEVNKANSLANIYDSLHQFVQYNQAYSANYNKWNNTSVNLNLQQKLDNKGDKELTADLDYMVYNNNTDQNNDNFLHNADGTLNELPYLLHGNLPSTISIYSGKADYKQTLKKNTTLEAGIKSSYVKTDNDAQYTIWNEPLRKWNNDTTRSNHFIYTERINAAYATVQKQIKKFDIKLGLRVEQTISEGVQSAGNQVNKQNYTDLFPTAYISYKVNDSNTYSISYGKRIQRPDYQSLNPFQYQLDRFTYGQGNPNLQPQYSHNIELGYNYKGILNLSANFTKIKGLISDVLITEKDGDNYITYQTQANISSSINTGISANYNKPLTKWWTINAFANVFYNHYKGVVGSDNVDKGMVSFNTNINNQFTFKKGWGAELSGFYNGKNLEMGTLTSFPMGMFSLGASKKLLHDKASIKLNIRDPFWLMKYKGISNTNESVTNILAKWDNRRAILTFTYRFGKNGVQERKRNDAEEQNRVKSGGKN